MVCTVHASDPRLGPPATVDGEHPFTSVSSPEAWGERSRLVRTRVALAAGLLPMPPRPQCFEKIILVL